MVKSKTVWSKSVGLFPRKKYTVPNEITLKFLSMCQTSLLIVQLWKLDAKHWQGLHIKFTKLIFSHCAWVKILTYPLPGIIIDSSVWINPQEKVRRCNVMKVWWSGVRKIQIRMPHLIVNFCIFDQYSLCIVMR